MAFTEFYCNPSTGDNRNSGSDAGTSVYTSTNGNWNTSTQVFTPTDGTNPATASPGVTVGQFASIYLDGANPTTAIGRVISVVNATNGAITLSNTAKAGTYPTTLTTGRTIKVGGCWKGPNGANPFPFSVAAGLSTLANATNASGDRVRVNMKNNASYSISANIACNNFSPAYVQGYSSSVGDLGKATIDGSTNAITLLTTSVTNSAFLDLIFVSSATTGTGDGVNVASGLGCAFIRCIAHGHRRGGFVGGPSTSFIECESYSNNASNTPAFGGFQTAGGLCLRCYSHDNSAGNLCDGFSDTNASSQGSTIWLYCISESNGHYGFSITGGTATFLMGNCDIYNNTSDGLHISGSVSDLIKIENCNFLKNGGWGINNTNTTNPNITIDNTGYGTGTQANSSGDLTGTAIENGKITYASGVTPWTAPSTGDFRINLAAADFAGRGAFTQTGNSKTGSVSYPDVGSCQHKPLQIGTTYGG